MSSDNSATPSSSNYNHQNDMSRQQRRGSVTSASLSNLFRSNSVSQAPVSAFPTPLTASALDNQRRRLSVTTFGLSGTSPTTPVSFLRRASLSTNSDSIDESAIEDDDSVRTAPTTPFTRRMSLGAAQAMRGMRGGISPGTNGRPPLPGRRNSAFLGGSPPTPPLSSAVGGNYTWGKPASQASVANQSRAGSDLPFARSDQAFNWSEQLRSRAESTVSQATARPSFSFATGLSASPPRGAPPMPSSAAASSRHDRAKSVSDMPAPPAQSRPRAPQKPDHFQERILKGDFYMD